MADDYRQRCADAAMNAWYMNAVLCDHTQQIPFGVVVDAVLAVRDQDAETLRSENEDLRKRARHLDAHPTDDVTVRRADLDLVMNGAGDATRMTGWAAACQRIRDALEGGQRG